MTNQHVKRKWFLLFAAVMLTALVVSPVVFNATPPSGAPVLFAMFAPRPVPVTPQSTIPNIRINNNTSSLEVIAVRPMPHNMLAIVLKNISSKEVNGYEILVRGKAEIRTDLSAGDWALSQGSTHELDIATEANGPEVTILAVMFTDGSIEGDPTTVTELKHWRLGIKTQLMRALPLLESALNSTDVFTPGVLDRLESQISSLPLESDEGQHHAASGARRGRSDLITNIDALRERRKRNGQFMQRQRLLDLKRQLERRITSL